MGVSVWFKVYCHKSLKTYESYGIVAQELNAESSRPTETKILPVQTSPLILYFIQLLSHGSKTKMLSGKTAASPITTRAPVFQDIDLGAKAPSKVFKFLPSKCHLFYSKHRNCNQYCITGYSQAYLPDLSHKIGLMWARKSGKRICAKIQSAKRLCNAVIFGCAFLHFLLLLLCVLSFGQKNK